MRAGGAVSFLNGRVKRRADDEASWKIPSGGGPSLNSNGSYRRNCPLSMRSSDLICVAALPDNRGEVVKITLRRGCGSDTSAGPVLERLLLGRPRQGGTVWEPVRFRLRFSCDLERKAEVTAGFVSTGSTNWRMGRSPNLRFLSLSKHRRVESRCRSLTVPHLSEEWFLPNLGAPLR